MAENLERYSIGLDLDVQNFNNGMKSAMTQLQQSTTAITNSSQNMVSGIQSAFGNLTSSFSSVINLMIVLR